MIFIFLSNGQMGFDSNFFYFGDSRESIRKKLISYNYTEDNEVIDMSTSIQELFMEERRDIYEGCSSENDFFILKYNKEDKLSEVEVNYLEKIQVEANIFSFNNDIDSIAKMISSIDNNIQKSEGEYVFKKLKIAIWNQEKIGGDGNKLGCFYCSDDITHLLSTT